MRNSVVHAVAMVAFIGGVPSLASGAEIDAAKLRAEIQKTFPKLSVEAVEAAPVAGLYEVTSGKNIIYYAPQSGHLLFGEIWSKDGQNITAKKREALVASKTQASLTLFRDNLSKAVKIGNGPREIIEITDPDCPYCRRMHEYWEKRPDVTRYVFFLPLKQLHPLAESKIKFILSSKDRVKTLREVYEGKYDSLAVPESDDRGLAVDHQVLIATTGISGTPGFFVEGAFVSGANVQAIEKIIGVPPAAPAAKN